MKKLWALKKLQVLKTLWVLGLSLFTLTALANEADLSGIKSYLLGQTTNLKTATEDLQSLSNEYYALAEAANFDYAGLWEGKGSEVATLLEDARVAWMNASPLYEGMEGIVAGTPSLAQFDVDLDAGSSSEEDPESAVSFDITLPNDDVLGKPGNLFGVTESTLWGTFEAFSSGVEADLNGNGEMEFGESLPDANVLKGSVDLLAQMASDLEVAANAWEPTESDAFTALAVMVPTMSEYFGSWRDSRFVSGETSTQRDFVAISRLADIGGILGGLQIVHQNLSPVIQSIDPDQDMQIAEGLESLKNFVKDVYDEEQAGKTFTAEEADLLG
ncbi:MAG: imelysin family protein, partial [Trueperaceae bacterium]